MFVKFEHIEERDIPCPFYVGTYRDDGKLKEVAECYENRTIRYYNRGDYATVTVDYDQYNDLVFLNCDRLISQKEAYEFMTTILTQLPIFETLKK